MPLNVHEIPWQATMAIDFISVNLIYLTELKVPKKVRLIRESLVVMKATSIQKSLTSKKLISFLPKIHLHWIFVEILKG